MESQFLHTSDLELLSTLENNSVDLILTDPPYIISKESGMQEHFERKKGDKGYNQTSKRREDFIRINSDGEKEIFPANEEIEWGRAFARKTRFGKWDEQYTIEHLQLTINEFFRVLRPGGTCIIFFDLWKIETLVNCLSQPRPRSRTGKSPMFSMFRLIEWIKTNPPPINSNAFYLSNAREIAIGCVKGGKPTFNSYQDKGIYEYPIYNGKDRFHPTQKSLPLFEELVKKHSNEGDVVLDPYGGSGTTYISCLLNNRVCISCEPEEEYYKKTMERIDHYTPKNYLLDKFVK